MRGAVARPGVASIVMGATLLLGALPDASARYPPSGTELQAGSTPETAPESTFSIFGLVESPGRYDWSAGMAVGQAVAAASGYADGGSPDELQTQRMVDGRLISRAVGEGRSGEVGRRDHGAREGRRTARRSKSESHANPDVAQRQ